MADPSAATDGIVLLAVSVGRVAPLFVKDGGGEPGAGRTATRQVVSAIRKTPVSTLESPIAVAVGPLGVAGDEQADLTVHGGLDQAVYLYPAEHYEFWHTVRRQAGLNDPLSPGAMGENLTIRGLLEPAVFVGDTLAIGEVRLRVTRPRAPCYKFNARMGMNWAVKMMVQSGFTGFYCEVVRPGILTAGDKVHVSPGDRVVTIETIHRMNHRGKQGSFF